MSIYKVRAHIGIAGNEAADVAAKKAAAFDERADNAGDVAAAQGISLFNDDRHALPHLGANWVQHMLPGKPTEDGQPTITHQPVDTLKLQVKKQAVRVYQNRILSRRSAGSTTLQRLHQLRRVGHGILKESVRALWSKHLSHNLRCHALRMRFQTGQVKPPCPLCADHPPNSLAHALGNCRHSETHASVCARHGHTVNSIADTVRKHVNCSLHEDAEGYNRTQRLPTAILPPGPQDSRPDLVALTGIPPASIPDADKSTSKVTLLLLDWFHTSDSSLLTRQTHKATQHHALAQRLHGFWPEAQVCELAQGMSHSGLLPGNFLQDMQAFGVPASAALQLIPRLLRDTLIRNKRLLTMRRKLLRAPNNQPANDPPATNPSPPPPPSSQLPAPNRPSPTTPATHATGSPPATVQDPCTSNLGRIPPQPPQDTPLRSRRRLPAPPQDPSTPHRRRRPAHTATSTAATSNAAAAPISAMQPPPRPLKRKGPDLGPHTAKRGRGGPPPYREPP